MNFQHTTEFSVVLSGLGNLRCRCGHLAGIEHTNAGCTKCEGCWQPWHLIVTNALLSPAEQPEDNDETWRAVAQRWQCLYREAAGLPPSEHTQRRLEEMAQEIERLRGSED